MRNLLRAVVALGVLLPACALAQTVSIDAAATETFDSLSSSSAGSVLPSGWFFQETSTTAPGNAQYSVDDGSSNAGSSYSYGTSGSSDRALGTLQSGSNVPTIGARLVNDRFATLGQLTVRYDAEQWRLGTENRLDKLDFEYSLNATSLTSGVWVAVDALDYTAIVTTGGVGAKNGNANATVVQATISGLSINPNATFWVRWKDFDASGGEDGIGIDNVRFSAGPVTDQPPAVTGTTPSNNAANVAITSNLAVSFSEPVTVTGEWLSLACVNSGARTINDFAVSGGPSSYTLNPATDFAYSESCTATISADAVADQNAPADRLAQDYVFAFTTVAAPVDNPPAVSATVPAAGASNVSLGATIQVTFSEPVTTSAAAFALTCNSVAQSFAFAGSGSVYTLDPAADLPAVETCAVAIDDAGVFDQDGTIQTMVADFLATFTTRAAGADYYSGVDASSCSALRATLHATIKDHTFYEYSITGTPPAVDPDTWDILNTADQDPLNPSNVLDIYKNESYQKISGGTGIYNREHTWPNSYGFGSREADEAYTDAHMLYVSNSVANSTRNNIPYDDCPPSDGCSVLTTSFYNGRGGGPSDDASYPGNHNWYRSEEPNRLGSFEVWNGRKGDAARAILYMDIRYEGGTNARGRAEPDLIVTNDRNQILTTGTDVFSSTGYMGIRSTLLEWHEADPPDAQEQLRNDVVFSYQENRNPFIDHPEWVALAFQSPCGTSGTPNATPVFNDATVAVIENASATTLVATLAATDADAAQTLTYAFVSGNDGNAFSLSSNGELRVANPALVDGAVQTPYTLVIRATDNGSPAASDTATITVNVTTVNDPPTFSKGANQQVAEDAGPISVPGWATAIFAGAADESGQVLTFEVMQNTSAALFAVPPAIASDGTLTYTPASNASGSATITIRLTDNGGGANASASTQFTIDVTPVNDDPTLAGATFSIASNLPNGSFVGVVAANDVDGPAPSYSIASGNTGGAFLIESDGEIRVANAAALTSPTYTLTIEASDGTATASATVTVNVTQLGDLVFLHGFE